MITGIKTQKQPLKRLFSQINTIKALPNKKNWAFRHPKNPNGQEYDLATKVFLGRYTNIFFTFGENSDIGV